MCEQKRCIESLQVLVLVLAIAYTFSYVVS